MSSKILPLSPVYVKKNQNPVFTTIFYILALFLGKINTLIEKTYFISESGKNLTISKGR
jgi:hypothetical protein